MVLVGVYVGAVVATARHGGHLVRPLFDGIGPPPAYQWVNPPAAFAKGNVKPRTASAEIAFTDGRSVAAALQTPDGQFVVNLGVGALSLHSLDTKVAASLVPVDPATLGPLPPGLRPDGNAYRIELIYVPSNQAVDGLAMAGNGFLTVPEAAKAILFSVDGQSWRSLDTTLVGGPTVVGAAFSASGIYLGAAAASTAPSGPVPPTRSGGIAEAVALVVGASTVVAFGPWLWRRRPRRRRA